MKDWILWPLTSYAKKLPDFNIIVDTESKNNLIIGQYYFVRGVF